SRPSPRTAASVSAWPPHWLPGSCPQGPSQDLQVAIAPPRWTTWPRLFFPAAQPVTPKALCSRITTLLRTWSSSTRFSCCTPTIASWVSCRSSTLRLHRHALFARGDRPGRGVSSPSPGFPRHRRSGQQVRGHHASGNADFLECLHATLHPGGFRKLALRDGRCRKIARPDFRSLRGSFWHPSLRRLW